MKPDSALVPLEPRNYKAAFDSYEVRSREEVEAERGLIERALHDPTTPPDQYCQYYAAQQALSWAFHPRIADSPVNTISESRIMPLLGNSQD